MQDPWKYTFSDEIYNDRGGQMTFGFIGSAEAVSPWGLLSFGFLWDCGDIWTPGISLSTAWASGSSSVFTSWASGSSITVIGWTGVGTQVPWAEC